MAFKTLHMDTMKSLDRSYLEMMMLTFKWSYLSVGKVTDLYLNFAPYPTFAQTFLWHWQPLDHENRVPGLPLWLSMVETPTKRPLRRGGRPEQFLFWLGVF